MVLFGHEDIVNGVRGKRSDCKSKNPKGVGFSPLQSDLSLRTLLRAHLRDLQVGVGVVPLRRDVLEGQAEGLLWPGASGDQVEVHGFVIRAAGAPGRAWAVLRVGRFVPFRL